MFLSSLERIWGHCKLLSESSWYSIDIEARWVFVPCHLCCIRHVHHPINLWTLWPNTGEVCTFVLETKGKKLMGYIIHVVRYIWYELHFILFIIMFLSGWHCFNFNNKQHSSCQLYAYVFVPILYTNLVMNNQSLP